jgi:hypothetical protein
MTGVYYSIKPTGSRGENRIGGDDGNRPRVLRGHPRRLLS